jgi:hypothetical protein
MADFCDFLYTQGGLRFKSGSGRVSLVIDGTERELRVIRNGKGRSRLDRGEINLRDVESYVPPGDTIDMTLDLETSSGSREIVLKLDPRTAMGREGRVKADDIDKETESLTKEELKALAFSQVRSLPYSHNNSEEAKARLKWVLRQDDLGVLDVEDLHLVAGYIDAGILDEAYDRHPGLVAGLVLGLSRDTADPQVMASLSQDVKDLIKNDGRFSLETLASRAGTPTSVLDTLSRDRELSVRMGVAQNTSTSTSVLEVLAKDVDHYVRAGVAGNTSTPPSVLEVLAKDFKYKVSYTALTNPSTPIHVLEMSVKQGGWFMRGEFAQSTATPPSVLEILAKDEETIVRHRVAGNTSTPESVLEVLAKDEDRDIRLTIAGNTSTPESVFLIISKDSD